MSADDLHTIESTTLAHYQRNAEDFWAGTRGHDVSQNYRAFLNACMQDKIANTALDILDFGCGPGRDLLYFRQQGHRATGLDGCENFCHMAREYSGCEVLHQQFLQLQLGHECFDGIFANASLFHVPSSELPRVLRQLHTALRPGGVLFTSNPRGNAEGWSGERYGCWMELDTCRDHWQSAAFTIIDHYYRPTDKPLDQQPWLAIISRKC